MDGEPPPAPVAATTSDLQKLRAQLKVYKRTFKEMHGRMPQKEDIQHRPKILHLYKQYSALQKSTATVTEGAPRVKEQENRSTFEANSSSSHPGESTNLWLTRKDLPDDRGGSKNPRKRKGLGEFDGGRLDKVSNTVAHAHLKSKNRGKRLLGALGFPLPKSKRAAAQVARHSKRAPSSDDEDAGLWGGEPSLFMKRVKMNQVSKQAARAPPPADVALGTTQRTKATPAPGTDEVVAKGRAGQHGFRNNEASLRHSHCLLLPVKHVAKAAPPKGPTTVHTPSETEEAPCPAGPGGGLEIGPSAPEFYAPARKPLVKLGEAVDFRKISAISPETTETCKGYAKTKPELPGPKRALAPQTGESTEKQKVQKSKHRPPKPATDRKSASNSGQISENYVRINLRKRWKGRSKLGSGKYRAHKEFMSKRNSNRSNKGGAGRKKSYSMNSGRDIIDSLIEAEDVAGKSEEENLVKCEGHGLVCKKLVVKKSGVNKGRPFFVCPLDRAQQCRFFAWADDSTEVALREYAGDETSQVRKARYLETETRKLEKLTTTELKVRLKNRNLEIKGKKAELVSRLAGSIVEAGFGDETGVYSGDDSSEEGDSDSSLELIEAGTPDDPEELLETSSAAKPAFSKGGKGTVFDYQSTGKCPSKAELESLLKQRFGFSSYRDGQLWGIQRTLAGKSSLVVIPTGGGKTLIYQVAAMVSSGLTLVISPLLSLMRDQLEHLPYGLHGASLNSTMGKVETARVLRDLKERRLKVLFVSPERLFSASFQRLISTPGIIPPISIAVIDEAHCVSEWSHNFRSAYMRLNQALRGASSVSLGAQCVLALTATATPLVVDHIATSLKIPSEGILLQSWKRPNLNLQVETPKDKYAALAKMLKSTTLTVRPKTTATTKKRTQGFHMVTKSLSTIVYVFRRNDADNVAKFLKNQGMNAAAYHANMSWPDRQKVQSSFISGRVKIIVATVAFGMGLDKADVRGVIHFHLPKSVENYIQEVGRAGRDGKGSLCHLFLDDQDFIKNHSLAHADSIDRVQVRRFLEALLKPASAAADRSLQYPVDLNQETISAKLDIKTNVIETLLCHLVLPPYSMLDLLPNGCVACTVTCKCPLEKIKRQSTLVNTIMNCGTKATPDPSAAAGRSYASGGESIKVNVPHAAKVAKVTENAVRRALDDLRFRGLITTSWSDLSFRCLIKSVPDVEELDEVATFLWDKTKNFETSLRKKAEVMYVAAASGLTGDIITSYFDGNAEEAVTQFQKMPFLDVKQSLSLLRADIRVLLRDQRCRGNRLATPRAITRIFHGISSPAFAFDDFKGSVFWGRHITFDFNELLGYVQQICVQTKKRAVAQQK